MKLKFQKDLLLAQIKQARDEHHSIFEEACEAYRKAVLAELDRFVDRIKKGERVRIVSSLPIPEEHTADFDRVLDMLTNSEDLEVTLTDNEYREYVLGEWDWRMSFLANTQSYTSHT